MTAVFLVFFVPIFLQDAFCDQPALHQHKRSDDMGSMETLVMSQAQKLSTLEAKLEAAENNIAMLQSLQGSSFVRWGRSTCPASATLLYSGIAGGSYNHHSGNGANRLCLTKEPVFDNTPLERFFSQLEGAEYYVPGHQHTDVLCAVCRTSHSVTYMVPGTNRCPFGSMEQYHGYLSAGDHNNEAASEYLCLDSAPEDRMGSQSDLTSAYFEHVRTHCGSLPCPPYENNKVVTCVVCFA